MHKSLSHQASISIIAAAGLLSLAGLWIIVMRLDPFSSTYLALALLYITIFFAASSIFVLLGYLLRLVFYRKEVYFVHLNIALRQGLLLGLMSVIMLALQSYRVLTWWDSILLVIMIVLVEFYFVSRMREY